MTGIFNGKQLPGNSRRPTLCIGSRSPWKRRRQFRSRACGLSPAAVTTGSEREGVGVNKGCRLSARIEKWHKSVHHESGFGGGSSLLMRRRLPGILGTRAGATLLIVLLIGMVSTPWLLLAAVLLAAAGSLCAFLVRLGRRKISPSLFGTRQR